MTGIFIVKLNELPLHKYGKDGTVEGVELAQIVWETYGKMIEGDKLTIQCKLRE